MTIKRPSECVHGNDCEQLPFSWHQWVSMGKTVSGSLSVGTIVIANCMQQTSTPTKSITLTALGEKHRGKNLDSFKPCYYPTNSMTLTALGEKQTEESLDSFKRCYYYFSFMGLCGPGSILVLHVLNDGILYITMYLQYVMCVFLILNTIFRCELQLLN